MTGKTILVQGNPPILVALFASFTREIQGERIAFAVTQNTQALGQVVTHVRSGLKVCPLGVPARYLRALNKTKTDDYRDRGELALDALIDRIGEAKVRSACASAPDLQP